MAERVIIYLVNALLILLIIRRIVIIDNDKAPIIFLFFYPVLLIVNFLIGVILRFMRKQIYRTYWRVCLWMVLLFIPLVAIIVSL